MTRGQRLQVSKGGTLPSWMEGGVCLDKDILPEEQLKTQPVLMLYVGSDRDLGQDVMRYSHLDLTRNSYREPTSAWLSKMGFYTSE